MIGKMGFHNYIYDEIYHFELGGGLGLKFELLGLLPDELVRRLTDFLAISSDLYR